MGRKIRKRSPVMAPAEPELLLRNADPRQTFFTKTQTASRS